MVAMEVLKDQNLLGIKIYILLANPLQGLNECVTCCSVNILTDFSNGTLDDYSPAQSLNKISASMRGTRSTTNNFNTSAAANSNSMTSAVPSITHSSNSSNLTIKSSKVRYKFKEYKDEVSLHSTRCLFNV